MTIASDEDIFKRKRQKLATLETYLKSRIHGQDFAVQDACEVFMKGELCDFPDTFRPKGSMIFMGPTGVGKTELVKLIAGYLFSEDKDLCKPISFDMVSYTHEDAINVFLGDKNHSGHLGEVLSKHTRGILLFDEIEKAHPSIMIQFMNMLDEGRIKCNNGESFSLREYYIIMTSNLGSLEFKEVSGAKYTIIKRAAYQAIATHSRPELAERIGKIVVFLDLTMDAKVNVCKDMLLKVFRQYAGKNIYIKAHESVISEFLQQGADNERGMRLMRNVVENLVSKAVSNIFISTELQHFHGILYATGSEIRIKVLPPEDPVFHVSETFIKDFDVSVKESPSLRIYRERQGQLQPV